MVPFRDSALTHVLKDSLSGNCKTTLVTAASPHKFNIVETISTFRFGSRCKLVKTKAEKNVVLSPAQMRKMIASLKTEIKSLKMQVLKGGGGGGMLQYLINIHLIIICIHKSSILEQNSFPSFHSVFNKAIQRNQ